MHSHPSCAHHNPPQLQQHGNHRNTQDKKKCAQTNTQNQSLESTPQIHRRVCGTLCFPVAKERVLRDKRTVVALPQVGLVVRKVEQLRLTVKMDELLCAFIASRLASHVERGKI